MSKEITTNDSNPIIKTLTPNQQAIQTFKHQLNLYAWDKPFSICSSRFK